MKKFLFVISMMAAFLFFSAQSYCDTVRYPGKWRIVSGAGVGGAAHDVKGRYSGGELVEVVATCSGDGFCMSIASNGNLLIDVAHNLIDKFVVLPNNDFEIGTPSTDDQTVTSQKEGDDDPTNPTTK